MKKTLQIVNILAFIAMIIFNYLSNKGLINHTTIGEVSQKLENLFTPASYAFSIWGFIYVLLLGFVVYQSRSLFVTVRDDVFIMKTGGWFFLSCLANISWLFFWLYGYIGLSVIAMGVLLFSLLKIIVNNEMELWDAPISLIVFLWWPFVFYSGWISVATISNVAAYLTFINWDAGGIEVSIWAIIMVVFAGILNIFITWRRNMREFALVGSWALIAIAVSNWGVNSSLSYTSLGVAIVLVVSSGVHGYKNRHLGPLAKLKEYQSARKKI
ncbi:tryptophan-rich sensory protein [Mesonia sp. K7]|uniref:tryptophan-rich sensory protein n=1 Tax=Mesonia sp. K7 TaxID=2218606 RepID=UPI000DA8DC31|nr:tryptophan-rich sensory protein [Mesonia sp. K7]PZD79314.1 tryptophan-rich sensory protein [Mesonia sp. K7]